MQIVVISELRNVSALEGVTNQRVVSAELHGRHQISVWGFQQMDLLNKSEKTSETHISVW